MKNPQTILITGASSGLGKALALEYANDSITLFLTGRNPDRLKETAKQCQNKGAKVIYKTICVKCKDEMSSWIKNISNKSPIDLVIANAGISAGTAGGIESEKQIEEIFDINLNGLLNTINPLIPIMKKRGKGQIALISSLAGFRGLPSSPAYSGSKAAVRVYGEGLRGSLIKHGIEVSVVCPGYIRTPMTDINTYPMPGLMDADKAAKIIRRNLEKNIARIAFPYRLYLLVWFLSILPPRFTDPIFNRLPGKTSMK